MAMTSYLSGGNPPDVGLGYLPLFSAPAAHKNSTVEEMYQKFQTWALRNYGDSGKTKTVTRRKYSRIVRILAGEEPATTENSKFRFWVKGKGFQLGPPTTNGEFRLLYVPSKKAGILEDSSEMTYKRVAIVEDFFRIIYNVHVEMDGRGGKHAGQKRTYRAIAETYSFLPREAVTRFLMSCSDCQKRMHLTMETNNNSSQSEGLLEAEPSREELPPMDYSLPITTAYLAHIRSKQGPPVSRAPAPRLPYDDDEDSMSSSTSSHLSTQSSPSPMPETLTLSPSRPPIKQEVTGSGGENNGIGLSVNSSPKGLHVAGNSLEKTEPGLVADKASPLLSTMTARNGALPEPDDIKPLNMSPVTSNKGHPDRKRRASSDSLDSYQTKNSESAADDVSRDDEDEVDDDDDDKLSTSQGMDPERLKAFNMFVRLFVDENLDRAVPISKQPKDKIQAILDACDRQFPEFHERSRKRIRTYLKSCRRLRRSKDSCNGWDHLRPTPPHLTSAAAESLLAIACENESNNAKRMRMGLEPLPLGSVPQLISSASASPGQPSLASALVPNRSHSPSQPLSLDKSPANDFLRHTVSTPTAFRPPHELPSPFFSNTNGIFRPGFPSSYPSQAAHLHPPVIQHTQMAAQLQNGPTDLSMKPKSSLTAPGSAKNQLNTTEVATIKQLIAGYRESAAFLYRSADELEQLLLHQN